MREIIPRTYTSGPISTPIGMVSSKAASYDGVNPFPDEKFLDPWWSFDAGKTWPQINDYREFPGNETAVPNNAKDRIAYISKGIDGATELPASNPRNLPTQLAAYASDMRSKYVTHSKETFKNTAQYKGVKAAGGAIVGLISGPAGILYGPWLDQSVEYADGILKGINALGFKVGPQKDIERAENNMNLMLDCYKSNLTLELPPAWQTTGLPVIIGGKDASDQYIKDVVCWNLWKWQKMPTKDQEAVKQWWALYLAQADDPEIATAFATLWNSSALADDTQVLLAAMPIAKAANISWQDLAERLWSQSKGWRSRPDLLRYYDGTEIRPLSDFGPGGMPINASNVQWQVLITDAFKLADEIKHDTIVISKPESKSIIAPVAVGGGGAITGFMIAGPIGAVIGGGLGWLLGSNL